MVPCCCRSFSPALICGTPCRPATQTLGKASPAIVFIGDINPNAALLNVKIRLAQFRLHSHSHLPRSSAADYLDVSPSLAQQQPQQDHEQTDLLERERSFMSPSPSREPSPQYRNKRFFAKKWKSPSTTWNSRFATDVARPLDLEPLIRQLEREGKLTEHKRDVMQAGNEKMTRDLDQNEHYQNIPDWKWRLALKSLCESRRVDEAGAVLSWMLRQDPPVCTSYDVVSSIVIHGLSKQGQVYDAFLLVGLLKRDAMWLPKATYSSLIEACARNGHAEKALELLERMRGHGHFPDKLTYSIVLRSCIRNNLEFASILRLYKKIQSEGFRIDEKLYNDMIVACASWGEVDHAMGFLDSLRSNSFRADVKSFVALITVLGQHGRTDEAKSIFEEMLAVGISLTTNALNALLLSLTRKGLLGEAEKVFLWYEKSSHSSAMSALDQRTFGLMIDAYARAGRLNGALGLFQSMKVKKVLPNSFIYSRLMSLFRDTGQWELASDLVHEMEVSKIPLNTHVYNAIIDTYGKQGDLERALRVFERMKTDGVRRDVVTWNSLAEAYCKAGKFDGLANIYANMESDGCAPSVQTFNILLNYVGSRGEWDRVQGLLKVMQSRGIVRNGITFTTLVDIYGKSGRFEEAEECLDVMREQGLTPNSSVYCALANAYAQKGLCVEAFRILKTMEDAGIEPNVKMLNLLVNAFGVAGKYQEALAVTEYMKDVGLNPDVVTYTTLMKALINGRKLDVVPRVFDDMLAAGCYPDGKAKDMLRSAVRFMRNNEQHKRWSAPRVRA